MAAYQFLVQDQATENWFSETDVHAQILGMYHNQFSGSIASTLQTLVPDAHSVQNANLVVALVHASLSRFKETHPWMTEVEIRMDNAGKY